MRLKGRRAWGDSAVGSRVVLLVLVLVLALMLMLG